MWSGVAAQCSGGLDKRDPGWARGREVQEAGAARVRVAESPCTASRRQHSAVKHLYSSLKKREGKGAFIMGRPGLGAGKGGK